MIVVVVKFESGIIKNIYFGFTILYTDVNVSTAFSALPRVLWKTNHKTREGNEYTVLTYIGV